MSLLFGFLPGFPGLIFLGQFLIKREETWRKQELALEHEVVFLVFFFGLGNSCFSSGDFFPDEAKGPPRLT